MNDRHLRRKLTNQLMTGLFGLCMVVALTPLAAVLGFLLVRGSSSVNLRFFTELPRPVGEPGGGMANAMVGSLVLLAIACAIALPIGVLAGVYLAEYGQNRFGQLVRLVADVLTGVPSITVGIFAYTLLVQPMRTFSALAGGVALAVIMLPIVTRGTEEMLRLVPGSLREAAYALGAPRWRAVLGVVLPTARAGVATVVLLAIARVAGETAPLLFTAFGNRYWQNSLFGPIAALPLQIFTYAIGPYDEWHRQAWAGALVLVGGILLISVVVRLVARGRDLRL
jgi:phosphate transport system permease protein